MTEPGEEGIIGARGEGIEVVGDHGDEGVG